MRQIVQRWVSSTPATAAIVIMLMGMIMFTGNDALGKWLTGTYSVNQLIFFRSIVAIIVLGPFVWRVGIREIFNIERPWTLALRVALTVVDTYAFYYAVSFLPLADVMTYFLAAPIYVAAFSPLLLGERVGWRRWTAIGFGFLGVIVALEPSPAMFTPAALVSVIGSIAFGFVLLTARSLRSTPNVTMIFWQSAGGLTFGILAIPFSWTTPSPAQWLPLIVIGLLAMLAHLCVNWAFKLADAATVAPLQYTQLFWAIAFGWLFFGDFPSATKLVGAAMIIASGLFIFFRERRLQKSEQILSRDSGEVG